VTCTVIMLLSSHPDCVHGNPPSFPTRRSSDLPPGWVTPSSLPSWIIKEVPSSFRIDFLPSRSVASASISSLSALPLLSASILGKDRKSTRLNSSHVSTSYADLCSKKQNLKK